MNLDHLLMQFALFRPPQTNFLKVFLQCVLKIQGHQLEFIKFESGTMITGWPARLYWPVSFPDDNHIPYCISSVKIGNQ